MTWGSGRGGRPWRRLRDRVLKRDQYLCIPCRKVGRLTPAAEVDHIVNVAKGGKDEMTNLRSICLECHKRVTDEQRRSATSRKVPADADGWPLLQGTVVRQRSIVVMTKRPHEGECIAVKRRGP